MDVINKYKYDKQVANKHVQICKTSSDIKTNKINKSALSASSQIMSHLFYVAAHQTPAICSRGQSRDNLKITIFTTQ